MEDEIVIQSVRTVAGVRENYLKAAFDAIDNKFGGFDSYLHNQLHFTDEMIQEMRDNYLEWQRLRVQQDRMLNSIFVDRLLCIPIQ